MSGPQKLAPVNGVAAMKLAAAQSARGLVNGWVTAMKEHDMSALTFGVITACNDSGAFTWGYIDSGLREQGYVIVAFSDLPMEPQGNTQMVLRSALVRSLDGQAKRVLLA